MSSVVTDVTSSPPATATATPPIAEPSSPNLDSEYDTASDSPSDKEGGGGDGGGVDGIGDGGGGGGVVSGGLEEDDEDDEEFHDNEDLEENELIDDDSEEDDDEEGDEDDEDEEDDDDDEEGDFEEGSIILDLERSRGDGQENEDKKKVDTAEDRSNPQYIPKKGTFYEHDDRTTEGPEGVVKEGDPDVDEVDEEAKTQIKTDNIERPEKVIAKPLKGKANVTDRWSHDRFDESEQAPKSRSELVSAYGYDIRNEDGPPKARRRRRYGRGPNKYTRSWEDEGAYGKTTPQRKPRAEDFPALGVRVSKRRPQGGSRNENRSGGGSQQNFDDSYKENYVEETTKRNARNSNSAEKTPPNYRNNNNNSGGSGGGSGGQLNRRDNREPRDRDRDRDRDDRNKRQDYREIERSNSDRDRDRGSSGFRTGRNTIEFKNQNRNKGNLAENSSSSSPRGGGGSGEIIINSSKYQNIGDNYSNNQKNSMMMSSSPPPQHQQHQHQHQQHQQQHQQQQQQQQQQHIQSAYNQQKAAMMESMSFTNTKMSRNLNNDKNLENYNRSLRGNESGQQHLPQQQQQQPSQHQKQSPQVYHHQEAMMSHPQQNYSSRNQPRSSTQMNTGVQPMAQYSNTGYPQQPSDSSELTHQQQMTALANTVIQQSESGPSSSSSSRPKRYSSLRQKSGVSDTAAQIPHQIVSAHHPSDPQLIQQMSELQYSQMQQQSQPKTQAALPIHMQPELLGGTAGGQQQATGQGMIAQPQQQQVVTLHPQQANSPPGQPNAVAGQQFSQTFYASTAAPGAEFTGTTVHTGATTPQIISGTQYSGQYPQPVASTYIQPTPPQPAPPPATYIPQQQTLAQPPPPIINYVPQTQFTAPPQFPNYPNYNAVPHNPSTSAIFQTQSGLTYYAPQTQTQPRPILPQRRPTNAIPIMAPPERGGKGRGRLTNNSQFEDYEEQQQQDQQNKGGGGGVPVPPLGSAENIDHILDNMFVQRAPYQPIIRKSSPSQGEGGDLTAGGSQSTKEDENPKQPEKMVNPSSMDNNEIKTIENSVKDLNIKDEPPVITTGLQDTTTVVSASTVADPNIQQ